MGFFPASDVVNRVISEFISPGQPHPALLAGVLKQIFRAAVSQDQQGMLTEWVLVSLPNFTRRAPLSHSIWCLSCFFLAASPNPWLQAMLPHLQHRQPPAPSPSSPSSSTPHGTSGCFVLLQQTSTQACLTRGKRRSSSRPLNRLQHLAAPMLSCWQPLNIGASRYAELLIVLLFSPQGRKLALSIQM